MMKKILFFLLVLPFLANAQVLTPVKWNTGTKDLGNNEYEISLKATIDEGWHMYSQKHPADGIGIPATITFEENPNVKLIGEVTETGNLLDKYSELFQQQEKYYEHNVTFKQKVKLKNPKETTVKFSAETQVCDAEKCLPPDWLDFSVKITPKIATKEEPKEDEKVEEEPEEIIEETAAVEEENTVTADSVQTDSVANVEAKDSISQATTSIEKESNSGDKKKDKSLWEIFILGVGGGLLALVMPCIFPMIPLTVSLFTKQSKSRSEGIAKALTYGLSIVVIFVALACLATLIFGASALNEFSTNPWVNIAFFVIFVFFAISFFGAFEIALPASWANYTDKQADKGGYIGIFFMAFTLVIISFSCTLPIIGSLATQASRT